MKRDVALSEAALCTVRNNRREKLDFPLTFMHDRSWLHLPAWSSRGADLGAGTYMSGVGCRRGLLQLLYNVIPVKWGRSAVEPGLIAAPRLWSAAPASSAGSSWRGQSRFLEVVAAALRACSQKRRAFVQIINISVDTNGNGSVHLTRLKMEIKDERCG